VEEWIPQELVELFSKIDCSGLGGFGVALCISGSGVGEKGEMGLGPCWAFGARYDFGCVMNWRFRRFCWLFRGVMWEEGAWGSDRGIVWLLGQFFSQDGKRRGPAGGSGLRRVTHRL